MSGLKIKTFFFILILPFVSVFFLQAQEQSAENGTAQNESAGNETAFSDTDAESGEASFSGAGADPALADPALEEPAGPVENEDTVYVIRGLKFDIDGISRSSALIYHGEFKEGERIKGKTNLERYLARKRQLLVNQRVLEEVAIEYTLGESEEDGAIPVKLMVYIVDSRNFIILPYPKYDSNDGISLTMKARDYNFLGTMSELKVDFGFRKDGDDNIVNFEIDSDTPFTLFGLNWVFNFDHIISLTFGNPLYYQNVTGLSVELPWKFTTFTVGFNQYVTFNEEVSDENKSLYEYTSDFYGTYGTSELFASWKIPFGIEVADFGEIAYTPKLSGKINYPYSTMDEPRKPVTTLSHTIGFGRTDWIGNLRKEVSASLGNSYSWFFGRSDAPLQIALDAGGTVHWPFTKYFSVSSRINYRQWWQWSSQHNEWIPYFYSGDTLRGIVDEDIRADLMLSLNLDLTVRVLQFRPSVWFRKPGLHFFDFEMYFSPFLDMALLKGSYNAFKDNPRDGTKFSLNDMVSTTGLEVIVFSDFFRSLKLRGSIGYNIRTMKEKGLPLKWGFFPQWNEIYIGLDLYY